MHISRSYHQISVLRLSHAGKRRGGTDILRRFTGAQAAREHHQPPVGIGIAARDERKYPVLRRNVDWHIVKRPFAQLVYQKLHRLIPAGAQLIKAAQVKIILGIRKHGRVKDGEHGVQRRVVAAYRIPAYERAFLEAVKLAVLRKRAELVPAAYIVAVKHHIRVMCPSVVFHVRKDRSAVAGISAEGVVQIIFVVAVDDGLIHKRAYPQPAYKLLVYLIKLLKARGYDSGLLLPRRGRVRRLRRARAGEAA